MKKYDSIWFTRMAWLYIFYNVLASIIYFIAFEDLSIIVGSNLDLTNNAISLGWGMGSALAAIIVFLLWRAAMKGSKLIVLIVIIIAVISIVSTATTSQWVSLFISTMFLYGALRMYKTM